MSADSCTHRFHIVSSRALGAMRIVWWSKSSDRATSPVHVSVLELFGAAAKMWQGVVQNRRLLREAFEFRIVLKSTVACARSL